MTSKKESPLTRGVEAEDLEDEWGDVGAGDLGGARRWAGGLGSGGAGILAELHDGCQKVGPPERDSGDVCRDAVARDAIGGRKFL
jgi:hypothetical protein